MIAYIDTSVLMRIVLQQPEPLAEWDALDFGVASALTSVEAYRSLDRLWHLNQFEENDLAEKRSVLAVLLSRFGIQPVDEPVLTLAAQPLPTPLKTLDAMHLATAMVYRASQPNDERPIVFATHDVRLARAAAAMKFDVIGVTL